jgi:hypothetical protein
MFIPTPVVVVVVVAEVREKDKPNETLSTISFLSSAIFL